MGDLNQYKWIRDKISIVDGPVAEIGSRQYGDESSFNYRSLFHGHEYVGIDMSEGRNVDIVVDLSKDFESIDNLIGGRRFGAILCLSVLEHCPDVFQMCRNLSRLAKKDATLFVSVPFIWRYHGYPDDIWRFTPTAIRFLFPDFDFEEFPTFVSANKESLVQEISNNMEINSFSLFTPISPKVYSDEMRNRDGYARWRSGQELPYLLAPTMINMIGKKKI